MNFAFLLWSPMDFDLGVFDEFSIFAQNVSITLHQMFLYIFSPNSIIPSYHIINVMWLDTLCSVLGFWNREHLKACDNAAATWESRLYCQSKLICHQIDPVVQNFAKILSGWTNDILWKILKYFTKIAKQLLVKARDRKGSESPNPKYSSKDLWSKYAKYSVVRLGGRFWIGEAPSRGGGKACWKVPCAG